MQAAEGCKENVPHNPANFPDPTREAGITLSPAGNADSALSPNQDAASPSRKQAKTGARRSARHMAADSSEARPDSACNANAAPGAVQQLPAILKAFVAAAAAAKVARAHQAVLATILCMRWQRLLAWQFWHMILQFPEHANEAVYGQQTGQADPHEQLVYHFLHCSRRLIDVLHITIVMTGCCTASGQAKCAS